MSPRLPDAPYEPTRLFPATQGQLRSARRLVRRKERAQDRQFLAEGPQSVREALAHTGLVERLFVSRAGAERHPDLLEAARAVDADVVTVSDEDLASLSDTVTPQGLVAVCELIDMSLDEALGDHPQLVVFCAQVRDPGNAGTVIRCADAFGADAVALSAESVEIYNPKTVRATAGSLFHLPISVGADLSEAVDAFHARGMQVLAADGSGDVDLDDLTVSGDLLRPTVWLMGNEAWGLPAEHAALADRVVRVPLYGQAESLNLSTAAAVCLYATASAQRRGTPSAP